MIHIFYAPFDVDDKVEVVEGTHQGKVGRVIRRNPEDFYYADEGVYFITFDGETEECKDSFGYWELALANTGD